MQSDLIVTTAIALEPKEQEEILKSLAETFHFSRPVFEVDPKILGGVKLILPDKIVDCSVARKLRQIRGDLTKREVEEAKI